MAGLECPYSEVPLCLRHKLTHHTSSLERPDPEADFGCSFKNPSKRELVSLRAKVMLALS